MPQSSDSSSIPSVINAAPNSGSLNAARFIVIGEGLAAGVGNFTLNSETQPWSFATQMARQMRAGYGQRLIQPPGVGNAPGVPRLPVCVTALPQTTVIDPLQPVTNLAVAEFTLDDAVKRRPAKPLIHRNDAKQTAINLIWGVISISQGQESSPTQLEYALEQSPTFTIVELGYYEALQAAVLGDSSLLPEPESFIVQYEDLLKKLKTSGSDILVMTIPDPLTTAHFFTIEAAATLVKVEPSFLVDFYAIEQGHLLNVNGVNEIGYQLFSKLLQPLPANSTLPPESASRISNWTSEVNTRLSVLAGNQGALIYDLAGLFQKMATEGYPAGTRRLDGGYLNGFYSLNGYYPGPTGQAIIANEVLSLLNRHYGSNFPAIDLSTVMATDSVTAYKRAEGPLWSAKDLEQFARRSQESPLPTKAPEEPVKSSLTEGTSAVADEGTLAVQQPQLPLKLPPGLEQVLPISKAASYFGDIITPLDCHDAKDMQFGSCRNLLFGGCAMVDSHVSGSIRFKFTPPVNDVTHFELSYESGLVGDDEELMTPQFYHLPFHHARVDDVPGKVSTGTLNLATGEVSDLSIFARYSASALFALVSVNPQFPPTPLNFPGPYGSEWARFEQRPDGKLDFTFYGTSFVPLGQGASVPLNFVGPSSQHASIPAVGTMMHPHMRLSTKEPEPSGEDISSRIPFNTVQEFTLYAHDSAVGHLFDLKVADLGGPAEGRSHLLGRWQIQFGPKTGSSSVAIAVMVLPPGGLHAPAHESPITKAFPAPLSAGPRGFNEHLRFPLRTYPVGMPAILDDPFDLSMGVINLRTGRSLNELLHRAFVSQDLMFALPRIEPRTPQSSFFFRGPARLTGDASGQLVFRFQGIAPSPYPEGFNFPRPDMATAFVAGPNSALDTCLWLHATKSEMAPGTVMEGSAQDVRSSTGDMFSYKYRIPSDPAIEKAVFEYENQSQEGSFSMHSLSWVDFSHSGTALSNDRKYDTVTFSGYGIWSKNQTKVLVQADVQISTSSEKPYVGIQISSGDISNVHTKPANKPDALP